MAIRAYISIITLNVDGLNAPTKRHRLAEWIQKQNASIKNNKNKKNPVYMLSIRDPFQI